MNPSFHQPQLAEVTTPTTPTQDTLTHKKALEWELSLDKCDLRSHAWYYGSITRQYADELIQKDGDFLVRDCVSQPGNYVLTCMAKGALLHFVINKVRLLVNKRVMGKSIGICSEKCLEKHLEFQNFFPMKMKLFYSQLQTIF